MSYYRDTIVRMRVGKTTCPGCVGRVGPEWIVVRLEAPQTPTEMNPTPQTYMHDLRCFPRYLPGADKPFRGEQTPDELRGFTVTGPTRVGWDSNSAINETLDSDGNVVDEDAQRGFGQADKSPWTAAMSRRDPNDLGVQALRSHLLENTGIRGLEICELHEVERACRIFHRDGFVIVKDLLPPDLLEQIREASARVLADILALPGPEGRKYLCESGRLPHRYSYGTSSSSRQMLHDPAWAALCDNPRIWPFVEEMYGSRDWAVSGAGGDLCLPGAVEYQHLHRDAHPLGEAPAPPSQSLPARRLEVAEMGKGIGIKGRAADELSLIKMRQVSEMLPPSGTINFLMTDTTALNGPIRQIPGSHANVQMPPLSEHEPEWMRLSTLICQDGTRAKRRVAWCFACCASHRAWHGATPNLSNEVRSMPNVEWSAAWNAGPHIPMTMPHEVWQNLSEYGKHVCRFVHAQPGVWPAGAGIMHPLGRGRAEAVKLMVDAANGGTGNIQLDGSLGQKPLHRATGRPRL